MLSDFNSRDFVNLTAKATKSAQKYLEAEQSQAVRDARQADYDFAAEILFLADRAKTVEDLLALEKALQKLDLMKAKTGQDRKSILAAQKSYEQFTVTLNLMRTNPDAYFTANMGHKETGGDPKIIVRGNSLDFIAGNVVRMRNREAFAEDGEREVWAARIAVAKRTGELFAELHNGFLAAFEEKQLP